MEALSLQIYQLYADPSKIVSDDKKQFVFIGRSNVGKSSLINLISKTRSVAHISQTPGKTKTINFYSSQFPFYVVDLPGYGFAKVSKSEREAFQKRMKQYFIHQASKITLFVLIDARHTLQEIDKEFITTVSEFEFDKIIVMTKTDKANQKELAISRNSIKNYLKDLNLEIPIVESSAQTGKGKSELLKIIHQHSIT